jgi:hypothetical protein
MAKKTTSKATKKAAPKKRTTKSRAVKKRVNDVKTEVKQFSSVCRTCHALPAGSVELVSLLLVLVFSLTAVLITSVHALSLQSVEISHLEAQLTHK